MNSKIALYILVLALIFIAFYVVKAKEQRKHHDAAAAAATDTAPPLHAKSAEPPKRPRH